jgi:hypothetical protein
VFPWTKEFAIVKKPYRGITRPDKGLDGFFPGEAVDVNEVRIDLRDLGRNIDHRKGMVKRLDKIDAKRLATVVKQSRLDATLPEQAYRIKNILLATANEVRRFIYPKHMHIK